MVHVLLIEDGLGDQTALCQVITNCGATVTAVCLAEEAIHRLQMGEEYDGIICDVAKANMTGVEFVEWLHANHYNHPPLLLHSRDIWSDKFDLRCFHYTRNGLITFRQKASINDGAGLLSYRYIRDFIAEQKKAAA